MPDAGAFAAWQAGGLSRRAIEDETSPEWLVEVFERMAVVHLRWAAKCLDLPPWEGRDWRDI